jgi:hypothetical protein
MFVGVAEFTSALQGDSAEFMEKLRALVAGVARDPEPAWLYVVRIDNWFGSKWMHFAGKFTAGRGAAIGVHKVTLHVPPFVPHRVVAERVFAGPCFDGAVTTPPLHIVCTSELALTRRIAGVDEGAAFVWFGSKSEVQKRGSIMVYLPVVSAPTANRRDDRCRSEGFYVGFSQRKTGWEPAVLRAISRGEVEHLEERGRTLIDSPLSLTRQWKDEKLSDGRSC